MLTDARSLAAEEKLEADICVVGAGPAGMTLALELAPTGMRICVLESGDVRPSRAARNSWRRERGIPVRQPRPRQPASPWWIVELLGILARMPARPHRFRGTRRRCTRLALRASGAAVPFYRRAEEICGADPFDYSDSSDATEPAARLPVPGRSLVVRSLQIVTSGFRQQAEQLVKCDDVQVLVNAVVSKLIAEAGDAR